MSRPRRQVLDLSHPIEHGMITYPGLPGPDVGVHQSYDDSEGRYDAGTEFTIGRIAMVTNTGTYLDAPAHRYRGGADVSEVALTSCVNLPAVVVDGAATGPTGPQAWADLPPDRLAGAAVLVRTGWSTCWRTERYGGPEHPFLTEQGAQALLDAGVALVGIDSVNIDDTRGGARPVHSLLLAAGIPVVEHLTALELLPATGARFSAVPLRLRGLGTSPVRAVAVLD